MFECLHPSLRLLCAFSLIYGCGVGPTGSLALNSGDGGVAVAKSAESHDPAEQAIAKLPSGEEQRKIVCGRPGKDRVRQLFCGPNPPDIRSLKDLQAKLGLASSNFVFTGHSSSLVGRFTSAINPRLIIFNSGNGASAPMVTLGFVRGEQFAELISRDPSTNKLNFFLLRFKQDCNDRQGGCNNGELLGAAIESNWREITLFEDEDIENTILDCKQCHQPAGPSSAKMLRMQELRNPWTHFMRTSTPGGRSLLADFRKAHPNQEFAGIPANRISATDPLRLELFVRANGFGNQPNEFPPTIEFTGPLGRNIWQNLYNRFVQGEVIAPPYHSVKVADPAKQAKMTQAYLDLAAGKIKPEAFPDTRDVLLDSGLRDMGFMVKDGLPGEKILVQACAQCHNKKLNQNISRAKFDIDLSKMNKEAKDLAIERINLPDSDVKKMPPPRFRILTPEEIKRLESVLRQ